MTTRSGVRALAPWPASGDTTWSSAGGRVSGFPAVFQPSGFRVAADELRGLDPSVHWTLHAAREALREARWDGALEDGRGRRPARGALVLGNLSFPTRTLADLAAATWLEREPEGARLVRRVARADGIDLRVAARRGHAVAYTKSKPAIRDLLAHLGAHDAVLSLDEADVISRTRERVNRATNCDEANLARQGAAARAQAEAIAALELDDLDAGLRLGRQHIGPKRSPLFDTADVVALARVVHERAGFRLVGVMTYEGQVAGVQDDVPDQRTKSLLVRRLKQASMAQLEVRRREISEALAQVTELEFWNGGGSGSVEATAADPAHRAALARRVLDAVADERRGPQSN